MKTKRNLSASIPNETRKAVYARDGYRCALRDDVPSGHAVRPPHTAEERYAAYRMLQDEYEQQCVEYVSDYYAERGEEWWPYK